MAFDWMNAIKTGVIAWGVVGIYQWIVSMFKLKASLITIVADLTADPLMTIIGIIVVALLSGVTIQYINKEM